MVKLGYNSFSMIKIKICGITNLDDALTAVEAGADAVGFVFHRESPRVVSRKAAATIIAGLPVSVTPVGVFVDEDINIVRETMDECGLRLAQLHGTESADYCVALGRPVIKAIRLQNLPDQDAMARYQVGAFLLDAFVVGIPGGTGTCADWDLATAIRWSRPLILAGGLTPENVGKAIRLIRPYGVDVSSGVEVRPGKKDDVKIRAFVAAAKVALTAEGMHG
jgi:phosphoribosylanthranilate isomerase